MSETDDEGLYYEDGLCALCGKLTIRSGFGAIEKAAGVNRDREPFVCAKCLVDLRGDMATGLEVRRQLSILEGRAQGLEDKLWNQTLAFNIVLAIASFLGGAFVGALGIYLTT